MAANAEAFNFRNSLQQRFGKFFTFQAPKLVVIEDIYVGILHKCLQLLFFIIIFSDLIGNQKYLSSTPVTGRISFWASEGNMKELQKLSAQGLDPRKICTNQTLYYYSGSQLGKYANTKCENMDYYEMHKKGENEFFVQTSHIESTTTTQDCTEVGNTCKASLHSVYDALIKTSGDDDNAVPGIDGSGGTGTAECHCLKNKRLYYQDFEHCWNHYKHGHSIAQVSKCHQAGDRCTCLRRRHVYTPGVEEMSINLETTMEAEWGDAVGMCSGKFHLSKPKLKVYGTGAYSDVTPYTCASAAGTKCVIPVKKLMELTGINSLDDPVAGTATKPGQANDYYSRPITKEGYSQENYNKRCGDQVPYQDKPGFCDQGEWSGSGPWKQPDPSGAWLNGPMMAGGSALLDTSTAAAREKRRPTYRQTGLALQINVHFEHQCSDGDDLDAVEAKVYVSDSGIVWNSKGSDVSYVDQRFTEKKFTNDGAYTDVDMTRKATVFNDECSCKKDAPNCKCPAFVDRYKFGMRSQFVITGKSTRTDPFYVLSAIAEAFVFIMISSSLVAVVAFYLIPSKSRFYNTRRTEEVNIDIVNARLAAQTAIAALSFRGLDENGDGVISAEEFTQLFLHSNPKLTHDQATAMANHILKVADTNMAGNISFSEFVKCISDDPKSLDLMYRNVARPKFEEGGAGAQKRLDAPFQMWEERVTAEGMKYYANHDTRVTTWYDPRQMQTQQGFAQAGVQGQYVVVQQNNAQVVPQGVVAVQGGAPAQQV